jgi:hypothetical protein
VIVVNETWYSEYDAVVDAARKKNVEIQVRRGCAAAAPAAHRLCLSFCVTASKCMESENVLLRVQFKSHSGPVCLCHCTSDVFSSDLLAGTLRLNAST